MRGQMQSPMQHWPLQVSPPLNGMPAGGNGQERAPKARRTLRTASDKTGTQTLGLFDDGR